MPATGLLGGLLGYYLLDFSPHIALVFGTIIVVTGPTVIGPLLRSINLTQPLESMLRWESIWGDVIGVILSALALKIVTLAEGRPLNMASLVILKSVIAGSAIGLAFGFLLGRLILPWSKTLNDEALPGIIAFATALFVFFISNKLVTASGPLAAAVTGFSLSRFGSEGLHSVRHFKEQLSILMISTLFILLVASVDPSHASGDWGNILAISLILGAIIRPLSVFLGLAGSKITIPERIYIGFISPRGIIALAAASFAVLTVPERSTELERMFFAVFAIIFLSGTVATLFGSPLAHMLGVAIPRNRGGILFVGGNELSYHLAEEIKNYVPVAFLNVDKEQCSLITPRNIEAFLCANALDEHIYQDAAEEGFTRVLAVTEDEAVNLLACEVASFHFSADSLFCARGGKKPLMQVNSKTKASPAFDKRLKMDEILDELADGRAQFETIDGVAPKRDDLIPLCVILPDNGVEIMHGDEVPEGRAVCLKLEEPLGDQEPPASP
jgi:NhaP-type Na+/H+ or K+/H+ antiporter